MCQVFTTWEAQAGCRPTTGVDRMKDPSLNLRMPKELVGAIEQVSSETGLSRAAVVRVAVARLLRAAVGADEQGDACESP